MPGDADVAAVAELFADRARSRILLSLLGGRELAAGVLADEAGISRSTASAHLRKLVDGGLLAVRADGRHRWYRISDPAVADVAERLASLAPPQPVTSLKASTRAARMRTARTCYDHLAGRTGVAVMAALLDNGHLTGGDGHLHDGGADRPASAGRDLDYLLTADGLAFLADLGVTLPDGASPAVRYCIDWTETRHHLAGPAGRAVCERFLSAGWAERLPTHRALRVTPAGVRVLDSRFGIEWPA